MHIRSLDGLRGLASLAVLLHHTMLLLTPFSLAVRSAADAPPWSLGWWLTAGPLQPLVGGYEAVTVFFVLSGFVLARSVLGRSGGLVRYDWAAYYPRRLVRLWAPAIGAIVLAVVTITVLPHHGPDAVAWIGRQADPDISLPALIGAAVLVVGHDLPDVDPPLWSLEWEIWGSLILPLVLVAAIWASRWATLATLGLVLVTAVGEATGRSSFMYLAPFAAGVLLAAVMASTRRSGRGLARRAVRRLRWPVLIAVSVVVLYCSWWLRPWAPEWLYSLSEAARVPAAMVITAGTARWASMRRALEWPPIDWLGRISFSLYLVHLPIVTGVGYRFVEEDRWIAVLIAVPVSFVVAWLFHLIVERPTIRLATWSGRATSRAVGRLRGAPA